MTMRWPMFSERVVSWVHAPGVALVERKECLLVVLVPTNEDRDPPWQGVLIFDERSWDVRGNFVDPQVVDDARGFDGPPREDRASIRRL